MADQILEILGKERDRLSIMIDSYTIVINDLRLKELSKPTIKHDSKPTEIKNIPVKPIPYKLQIEPITVMNREIEIRKPLTIDYSKVSQKLFSTDDLECSIQFINNLFNANIISRTRDPRVSCARAIYFKFARMFSKNSTDEIGDVIGTNVVTVVNAIKRYDERVKVDGMYRDMAIEFTSKIKELTDLIK